MDKLTLAALEATLEEYTRPEGPTAHIPTLEMIGRDPAELEQLAVQLAGALRQELNDRAEIGLEAGAGRVGGGALPLGELPGSRVVVRPRTMSSAALERRLRTGNFPVIALMRDQALLLDTRTILKDQFQIIPKLVLDAMEST
jgi:L-seryl-tRNA(Ser) seleniumtransferase